MSCATTIGVLNRDCVGTCSQVAKRAAVTERNAINCVSVRTSSTRTGNRYTPSRIAEAGNIGLRTNRRANRCGGLGDCDRLSRGATIGILDCDCVGTGPEAAESTARTKGSTIDRVSIRRSSARTRDCYTPGCTTEARDIGLRTDRGPERRSRLCDRDRLGRSAAVGVFDRDRVGTGSQATECSACSKTYAVFRKCVGRSSARTRDCDAAGRTAKAGNIGLRTNRCRDC